MPSTPLTPADIGALSRLLDVALALDATERESWLATLPPQHRPLVPKLRRMLSVESGAAADRTFSSLPRLHRDESVAEPGERVGAYRLIREIGRGGMGSVWLAARADGHFKRELALKLPRLAWGAGLSERMVIERDITALLEHPHIARLYDAGVDDRGRPFIATEYIEGVPIDAYCQSNALDVRARLALFLQAVRAVSYAHGRLVVHRDLKPANMLVDGQGQVHLLDFGIAKMLDGAGSSDGALTLEHGRVMTPQYASPEQIAGQTVGVAADVYSLGVVLYELLTETLPFAPKRRTASAVEEAILQGDAPAASTRVKDRKTAHALSGDVDAMLSKAMRRDPGQRYATSDALAQDIERHLAGETVLARPDSAWYRVRKVLVRHRLGFGAGAAIAVTVLAGSVVAIVQARDAAHQAEKARIVMAFVTEVFKASTQPAPAAGPGRDRSTEPLLDQVGELITARFSAQPDVQAALYAVVGRIYADIGAGGPAADFARRELAILDRLGVDNARLVRAHLLLADSLRSKGQLDAAVQQAQAALRTAGGDAGSAAEARALLARLQLQMGRIDEAWASALAVEAALAAPGPATSIALAWAGFIKAEVLRTKNDFGVAWPQYERAVNLAVQFEGQASNAAVEMRLRLDQVLTRLNRIEQARHHYDAAQATLKSAGTSGQIRAAVAAVDHWSLLYDMRATSFDRAVEQIEQSRDLLATHARSLPPSVLATLEYRLGVTYLVRGELSRAAPLMEAHAESLTAAAEQPMERFYFTATLGHLAMMLGAHERADHLMRAALEWRVRAGQASLPFAAFDWTAVAQNLLMQGRVAEADDFLSSAPAFGAASGDRLTADLFSRLIPIMRAQLRLEAGDAADAARRLGPLTAGLLVDTNSLLRSPLSLHGTALCASGSAADGLPHQLAAIASISIREGDRHPGLARLRALAGLCALKLGNRVQAAELALASRAAFARQPRFSAYFEEPLLRLEEQLQREAGPASLRSRRVAPSVPGRGGRRTSVPPLKVGRLSPPSSVSRRRPPADRRRRQRLSTRRV